MVVLKVLALELVEESAMMAVTLSLLRAQIWAVIPVSGAACLQQDSESSVQQRRQLLGATAFFMFGMAVCP